MVVIVTLLFCDAYIQMPLATPECVIEQHSNPEQIQATYEDCAALARLLWWIGDIIHARHDDIIALATVVVAIFTFTLWRATDRLWRSAENQLREFQVSVNIANEHAGHMAASVKQSKRVAKTAAAQFRADHRPWIPPRLEIGTDMIIRDGIMTMEVIIGIENIGNSPAFNVQAFCRRTIDPADRQNLTVLQAQEADALKQTAVLRKRDNLAGLTLFPGEKTGQRHQIIINMNEPINRAEDGFIFPHIYGGIYYEGIDGTCFETGLVYLLGGRTEADREDVIPWGMRGIPIFQSTGKSDMILWKDPTSSGRTT